MTSWMATRITCGKLALAALVVASASIAVSAPVANATTVCPLSYDTYTASAAVLAACGISTYGISAVVNLPGGGTRTSYATGGPATGVITPPTGFDPITATPSQLAEYEFPPEPPASNPSARSQWLRMVANLHFVPAGPVLHGDPNIKFGFIGDNNTTSWSGYYAQEGSGYFHYSQGTFVEPTQGSSRCSNTDAGFWTGLRGVGNGALGQEGTAIGGLYGVAQYQAWYETNLGTVFPVSGIYATAGQDFYLATSYSSGTYYYYYYNYYNGQAKTTYAGSSSFSGATAESITERPSGANLANFGTMDWDVVTATSSYQPIGNFPYAEALLWNSTQYNYLLATNGSLNSGDTFTVKQDSCN